MKRVDASLLSSLDQSWKNFSVAWKNARTKASEKSVHDLRVSTRRLIAILELGKALSTDADIAKLQRRFKKVLKRMGPLRDTQVLLVQVARIPKTTLVGDFKKSLIRRERREIDNVHGELKRGRKQKLSKAVNGVRSEFGSGHESFADHKIHRSIERVLTTRGNALLKAQRRFHGSQSINEELLHEMRIALKKFRYVVEAAQPVLGNAAKTRARELHGFQQLIGDSRDVELLRNALAKWANKNGKRIAVVPALNRLEEQRDALLKKIMDSLTAIEHTLTGTLKPVAEKTHAAGVSTIQTPKVDMRRVTSG